MQRSGGFNDSHYSEADKAIAREYARTKALVEPQAHHPNPGLESRHGLGVSVTVPSSPVTENPFHSTDTRRVGARDIGRQVLQNDRGEAQYYQAYLEAPSVVRKTMLSRVQEQKRDYDAEAVALLQNVSLDTQPSLPKVSKWHDVSSAHDYVAAQTRLEAEADQYASNCLTLAGPTQQENMKLFQEARNEYLFVDEARRAELTAIVKRTLPQHSQTNTGAGFLPQSTRRVSNPASKAPSITEDAYVERAVVAFKDLGVTERDARYNYREALKNQADLEGLGQALVDMEKENSRPRR